MSEKLSWIKLEKDESIYTDPNNPPASKEKLLDAIARSAYNYHHTYSGCTRAVLLALNEHLDLAPEEAFKYCFSACSTLPGGVARMGEVCGALTGALLAIGLACGPKDPKDVKGYSKALKVGHQFFTKFKETFKHVRCQDLLDEFFGKSINFWDPEERTEWIKAGGPNICSLLCAETARLAGDTIMEILATENQKSS
ncbi:MAG: C_GCAxxG_C_C family protein [Synergistetes bacterium]|nr:MAG: C_GCAxxG_C_C family protein [bacterium 42_11]MBC7332608.1 C_GCAxxG_C_C family protein [Synergistota bacterium]